MTIITNKDDIVNNLENIKDAENNNAELLDATITTMDVATFDVVQTDNFTLVINHSITAGDMLVATLLSVLIVVIFIAKLVQR